MQITRMLEQMNIRSTFVDGLRVTNGRTLEAVAIALLGQVQVCLVQALRRIGLPAVGVFGAVSAKQKDGPWGLVGTRVEAETDVIVSLLAAGKVPVIPTLAIGEDGLLNVNGDETAAAVAIAVQASRLVFLTDVAGVWDGQGQVIPKAEDVDHLLGADHVSGGMLPKLHAVKAALEGGVPDVRVGETLFGAAL